MGKKLALGISLSTLMMVSTQTWAAVTETETEITDAISKISPYYKVTTSDTSLYEEIDTTGVTNALNLYSLGTFAQTTAADVLWELDSNNDLYAHTATGNAWRTFKAASVAASWNASSTVTLAETVRDGAAGPGSPYSLVLTLTKTGTPADLTRAILAAFLAKSTTKTLAASAASPTQLVGSATAALTTGWTAKAHLLDGSAAAVAATLAPVSATITVGITPPGSTTAVTYTSIIPSLYSWNVTAVATTTKSISFTSASNSYQIKFKNIPGPFARTADIATGLVTSLNAMPKRIYQAGKSFLNSLPNSVTDLLGIFDTVAPNNLKDGLNLLAKQAVSGASFAIGDFTTTADTNKIGLAAFTSANLASVTWSNSDRVLIANAKIGTGPLKDFKWDGTGIQTVKTGTNEVLEFKSDDGDTILFKVFDATGYDTSASTAVAASDKDLLCVLTIKAAIGATGTVQAHKLKPLITASQS